MHRKAPIYLLVSILACLAAGIAVAGAGDAPGVEDDKYRVEDDESRIEKKIVIERVGHGGHGPGNFFGVQMNELTRELRVHFGVPEDVGVLVSRVVSDSPAERAGVRVGDVLARVAGEDVTSSRKLRHLILRREHGETVDLEVWRDGRVESLSATLEVREGAGGHRMLLHHHCGDGEDCDFDFDFDFDCWDGEGCQFRVECDDGDCQCLRNGEAIDCAELPGHGKHFRHHHEMFRRHHQGDE